jgi:hypothetical protein
MGMSVPIAVRRNASARSSVNPDYTSIAESCVTSTPTVLMTRKPVGPGSVEPEEPAQLRIVHVEHALVAIAQQLGAVGAEVDGDASRGFRADNGSAGRPAKPRVVDLVRERIEAEIDEWLKVLEDAREAVSTIVVGTGPNARTVVVPDFSARLKAFQVAFDRGYGRPKQTADVEVIQREQVTSSTTTRWSRPTASCSERRHVLNAIERDMAWIPLRPGPVVKAALAGKMAAEKAALDAGRYSARTNIIVVMVMNGTAMAELLADAVRALGCLPVSRR